MRLDPNRTSASQVISISIDAEREQKLRAYAQDHERSVSQVIRDLVDTLPATDSA